jgi:uncharacterized membrane protein YbhN (UPF0104 family)
VKLAYLRPALKYGLGIGVLVLVIWRNWSPRPESGEQGLATLLAQPVQFGPLLLATLAFLIGLLLTFWRWHLLVRAQGLPFTGGNALRLGLIGFFLSNFIPAGSIGGDIAKAAFIAREQTRRTVAVATVLIDRALGLWGLIWLVALVGGGFWVGGNEIFQADKSLKSVGLPGGTVVQITPLFLVLASATIVGITLALWLFLTVLPAWRAERFAGRLSRIPKLGGPAAEFWRAVWMYRCQRRHILAALGLALVGHVCFVMSFYYAAQVFQDGSQIPSLAEHFLLVPIGMTFMAFFPSPGGVGGGEWAFGELYALIQPGMRDKGVAAMLTQRVIIWGLSMVGYFVFLQMRPALRPAEREEKTRVALAKAS